MASIHFQQCLFLLLFFVSFRTANAQPPQAGSLSLPPIAFERLGVEHGLPNEYVNCIAQDRFGFMWFGTKNGLCRYDGQTFKTYQSISGDSCSLMGNEVLALFSDASGVLWVGANGLHRFNADHDNFTRIVPPRYPALSNNLKYVAKICEDHSGNLWFGTFGRGLYKLNPASGQLLRVKLGDEQAKPSSWEVILSLFSSGLDSVWVTDGTYGLTILNARTGRKDYYSLANKGQLQKTFLDRAGRLWLGAMHEPFMQIQLQAHRVIASRRVEEIKLANFFTCMEEDHYGNLWIGTQQEGLYLFNPSRNETRQYRHHSREQHSLPGDEILDFLIDRSGNMWIATDKGVGKWARWKKPFRHFQHDTENPNSINKAEVTGIDTDSDGELWISSLNAGFCKFNPRTGIFTRYDPSTCSIKSPFAMEILAGRNGSIWIATNFVHGLNRFDPVTGKFMEFLHDPADTTSLSSDLVTTLFEDYEGRIWVGPAFNGLNLYEPRLERFRRFQHDPSNPATLSHNNVLSIYQDEALRLWIGTGHGLNRFDPDQNSFVRFVPDEISSQSSGSFELYDICEDLRRRLWLGTNLGLYLFERQAGRFERFAVLPGLADARIFGILEDGAGSLWLQATTAIAKFNPQTRKSRVYGRDDGWIQNGIHEQEWHHAVEKFSSGELVFGGSNGITIFHPDSIRDNPNVPPVHITGFNLFYEPVEISKNPAGRRAQGDSLLTRTLLSTEELILRHSERTFSFEFAALDYTQPEANQYAFKLEGFHDDWIYSGNEHTATFTNIPTGEYTFRVKGANNDGLWNEEGDAIRVSILPPWWKTKLAYATYVLLVCAALLAAWRFETNRMQMRNELRLREFEAKKMQEVDHLKSRFFANISHEFRTPLTLILGPLEGVIAKVKNQTAREDLRVMQRNANRLLRLINQLLDLSRLEDGRMQLQAGRGDLIAFLRGIVMSFASLADQKKIILKFESALELPDNVAHEIYFDRDKIEKIFYNLLSNAFKFTPEGGEVRVKLGFGENDGEKGGKGDAGNGREGDGEIMRSLSPTHPFPPSIEFGTKEFVKITISDTGIGIPADRLPYVFDRFYQVDDTHTREHEGTGIGLALTKELVERHYGTIAVRSEAGKGTEFIVRLPLGKEHLKAGEIVEDESRGQLSVISDQFSVFSRQTSVKRQRAREQDSITPSLQHSNEPSIQSLASSLPAPASGDSPDIVLVIDDHPDMRHYVRRHLESSFQVLEAKDGREGVELALEAIPDLVICDVMMPQLDGFQVCERLKTNEKTSHVPVILLTAKAGEESKLAGLETGADDYLIKPFNFRELQLRVHNLIEQRRKLRERFRGTVILKPSEMAVTSTDEVFLNKVLAVVEKHLDEEEFSVETLGQEVGMSRSQIHRKLRALTNQPPILFIRSIRLQRAADLLRQNAGSIAEIAYQVGFSSQAYFTKCFHEQFGVSPKEFRSKAESQLAG